MSDDQLRTVTMIAIVVFAIMVTKMLLPIMTTLP